MGGGTAEIGGSDFRKEPQMQPITVPTSSVIGLVMLLWLSSGEEGVVGGLAGVENERE